MERCETGPWPKKESMRSVDEGSDKPSARTGLQADSIYSRLSVPRQHSGLGTHLVPSSPFCRPPRNPPPQGQPSPTRPLWVLAASAPPSCAAQCPTSVDTPISRLKSTSIIYSVHRRLRLRRSHRRGHDIPYPMSVYSLRLLVRLIITPIYSDAVPAQCSARLTAMIKQTHSCK